MTWKPNTANVLRYKKQTHRLTGTYRNPSLDTNTTGRAPEADFRYCMGAYDGASVTKPPPIETESPSP